MTETIEQRVERLENSQVELQDSLERFEQILSDAFEEMDPLEEAHQKFVQEIKNRRTGHA